MPNPNRKIENYTLKVTAGPSRDISTHKSVPVNTEQPLHIETDDISTDIYVRIQGYRHGGPHEPSTSPYFSHPSHTKDKYSISFAPIIFKNKNSTSEKGEGVNGDDLVLGNDFDHSISQHLPPGFSLAWKIARWAVDPGLEGDPWAEKPWLEGRALGSVNVIDVGDIHHLGSSGATAARVLEEGLGKKIKLENNLKQEIATTESQNSSSDDITKTATEEIPQDPPSRMKFFLTQPHRAAFTFEPEEKYWFDFFNPYLDFNEFALHLPGISIPIIQYWDGQPLRYVLRNRVDERYGGKERVYAVVQFTLVGSNDEDEENEDDDDDDEEEEEEVIEEGKGKIETSADNDVD